MILTTIFVNWVDMLVNFFTGFNLPHLPTTFITSFHDFLDLVFGNLSLLGLLFRPTSFKIFCVIAIALINFEHIYGVAMYVYHKVFNRL